MATSRAAHLGVGALIPHRAPISQARDLGRVSTSTTFGNSRFLMRLAIPCADIVHAFIYTRRVRHRSKDFVTHDQRLKSHALTMIARTLTSSHYKTTSGTNTHYLQGGDPSGPLLVCLHGLGGSTETFSPLVPFLPQAYNIVLVDFPGFGKTPLAGATRPLSVEGLVSDLEDLITHLRKSGTVASSKAIVAGHSLGAIVALQHAAIYLQSVAGLLLLGPGRAAGHMPAVRQRMLDLAAAVRKEGIDYAANIATKSNFYDDRCAYVKPKHVLVSC